MISDSAKNHSPSELYITGKDKNISIPGRVYYSHPISTYGKGKERDALSLLKHAFFSEREIVNPKNYKFRCMEGYLKLILTCDIFAYHDWGYSESTIARGVALELYLASRIGMPIWFIGTSLH